ncbi:MAG: phytanoyl-CoA dioxygenase family protein [Phycisphaeraceae bacterium]|nr:phytanoyl-CoA dioxygenase family protein [Phycisphaeraceae bacterium]
MARTITLGEREVTYGEGEYVTPLRDANDVVDDLDGLKQRLEEDGYLWIRGLHPRERVLDARRTILEYVKEHGQAIDEESGDLMEAKVNSKLEKPGGQLPPLMGKKEITHNPAVRAVLEGEPVFDFFEGLFQEQARTFDYKWLRAVGPGGCTGAHYDFVYMGRGSGRLMTCWVPIGDISLDMGTLAICVGSHRDEKFKKLRETYGQSDVDTDRHQGWFTKDPHEVSEMFGGRWAASPVEAGDVIVFGMHTMHMSTRNDSDRWRLSCDTRFQPAADPVDERWAGENPTGHDGSGPVKTAEESRAEWNL